MGLIDRAMSAMRSTSTPATPAGTPFPDLSRAQGGTTAQAARATGVMTPEAAAYNAQPKGAFPASAASAKPGLQRAGNIAGKSVGAIQGVLAAKDMLSNGVGLDNATNLISSGAKFAGPMGMVGASAFDVGKIVGKSPLMPDSVATGLAKAYNYVTGNGDRNKGDLSTVGANMSAIDKVIAEYPNGRAAKLRETGSLSTDPTSDQKQPQVDTQAQHALQASQGEDKFSKMVDSLADFKPATQVRATPSAAASYRAPPELDFSHVQGDLTGIGTLNKVNAQAPAVANWAAGMKQAKYNDAMQMQYDNMNDANARAGDQLKIQGLGKAADIYSTVAQRRFDREMTLGQRAYQHSQDNEKRFNDALDSQYGPVLDKDGKPNSKRSAAENAIRANMANNGMTSRGQYSPAQQDLIIRSIDLPGYEPSPSIVSDAWQKFTGHNPVHEVDPIRATTAQEGESGAPTHGPGGVGLIDANGRWKTTSDMGKGGLVEGANAQISRLQAKLKRDQDERMRQYREGS